MLADTTTLLIEAKHWYSCLAAKPPPERAFKEIAMYDIYMGWHHPMGESNGRIRHNVTVDASGR